MAQEPKKPDAAARTAEHAPASPSDGTVPLWQPPGSATRSMSLSALPDARALVRSQLAPHPQQSGVMKSAAPGAPSAFDNTIASVSSELTPSDAPQKTLEVGDTIGERYVIDQAISAGSFGAVFRAKDRQIENHQVALKLLHKPAANEEEKAAALRELTLIASVSHPSAVQFKDYGWFEGRLWFAMPWYDGQTLDQRFDRGDGVAELTRKEARPLFERISLGLAAMHEVGICHYDIKPENIFLADIAGFDGGLPVLLDLGIASKRGEGPKGLTPEYAAPEVAATVLGETQTPVGAAADVFSLALVMRNLLEPETTPSIGGEIVSILHTRATEPLPSFTRRDLKYLQPTFDRLLSRDPADRPTATEFAQELAILTAPEERREARARILRRVVPIVLLAALAVSILLLQLRKQETQITVQKKQITEQLEQSAVLRAQQTTQLEQLEAKSEELGTQSERLQKAIALAKSLSGELQRTERSVEDQRVRLRKLQEERSSLQTQTRALGAERDTLVAERNRLSADRDELRTERTELRAERDELRGQRDTLATRYAKLEEERNAVLGQRNDAIRERDRLQNDLAATRKKLDSTAAERDATRKAYDEVRDEVKSLRDQVKDLKRERDRLEAALKKAERKPGSTGATTSTADPDRATAETPPGAWK
jgi:serine/threonine protein kinase